jgi:hypothetical protein
MTGYETPKPNWKGDLFLALLVAMIVGALFLAFRSQAKAQPITPDQYHAQIGPCACPDDHKSDGRKCGHDSAYCRCGGLEPACYPGDGQGQRESNRKIHCGHVC